MAPAPGLLILYLKGAVLFMVFQQVISGLAMGSIYALVALGVVLLYKTSDVINFGYGEMAMIGAFISATMMISLGLPYPLALLGALAFGALIGMAVERGVIRNMGKAPHFSIIIITLALLMIINGIAGLIWGHEGRPFPYKHGKLPLDIAGVVISWDSIIIFAVTLVIMLAIFLLFKYSMLGIAMRAVGQNKTTSMLMGIKVNRILSLTWAASTAIGVAGAILIAPIIFLEVNMMHEILLKGFAGAVLGGFTSLPGAVVGGLLLGVIESLAGGYISTELKGTIAFSLLILVLCIKPTGLLGVKTVKKV